MIWSEYWRTTSECVVHKTWSLSLADMLRRTQKPPLRTLPQRLKRGVTDRAETARWAHSSREWLRIWWSLVDVRRTDTWRMLMAKRVVNDG